MPIYHLCFGDGESYLEPGALRFKHGIIALDELDVLPVGRRGRGEGKIINVGQGEAQWDL